MKNRIFTTIALSGLLLSVSCKDNKNAVDAENEAAAAQATAEAVVYNVDTELSSIAWVGSKVAGEHKGNISLSDGKVSVNGEKLESGKFTIDMTSIEVTDLEGEEAMNLKAHLEGTADQGKADFFNTTKYPKAMFVVTGLKEMNGKNWLEGNLTLKDVTKNVKFPVNVSYQDDKMMLNSEEFTIDRTDWGIKYGSESLGDVLKENAISDNIILTVNLVAKK